MKTYILSGKIQG